MCFTRTRLCALGSFSLPRKKLIELAAWLCGEASHVHCPPTLLCPDETSSKINSIISFSIGGGILAAMLLLIGIVTCIYFKVAKAMK